MDGLALLEAWALFDGEEREVHNRVGWGPGGALYYDLSDPEWRAVRITAEGWSVDAEPSVAFRRYSHMRPQVEPVRGGNLLDLYRLLNIPSDDDRLRIAAKLPTDLIPDISHIIANFHGPQGAAKSTGQRMLRRIVDPSTVEVLTLPRDSAEMLQLLDHHYAPIFDNVRDLQPWQSDMLCRASTGEGSTKRELYTDDNDIIRRFRRPVSINGINVAGESPDYLDRSDLFSLERIPRDRRKPERAIWAEFDAALPSILGAVLDALSGAMRLYPTVAAEVKELPRMADFALWGEATSRALGNPPGAFLDAYNRSIAARNKEAIEASPVGAAVLRLLAVGTEDNPGPLDQWEGTAGDLLRALKDHAEAIGVDRRERSWPKSPESLGKRLREVRSNLAEEGVLVEFSKSGGRVITISPGPESSGKTAQTVQPPKSQPADTSGSGQDEESNRPTTAQEKPAPVEGSGRLGGSDSSAGISGPPGGGYGTCPCGIRGTLEGGLCALCASGRGPGRTSL